MTCCGPDFKDSSVFHFVMDYSASWLQHLGRHQRRSAGELHVGWVRRHSVRAAQPPHLARLLSALARPSRAPSIETSRSHLDTLARMQPGPRARRSGPPLPRLPPNLEQRRSTRAIKSFRCITRGSRKWHGCSAPRWPMAAGRATPAGRGAGSAPELVPPCELRPGIRSPASLLAADPLNPHVEAAVVVRDDVVVYTRAGASPSRASRSCRSCRQSGTGCPLPTRPMSAPGAAPVTG